MSQFLCVHDVAACHFDDYDDDESSSMMNESRELVWSVLVKSHAQGLLFGCVWWWMQNIIMPHGHRGMCQIKAKWPKNCVEKVFGIQIVFNRLESLSLFCLSANETH